jgi:predicted 3-demethylubiquinone-9 3-methyltransferase (glyoxalase superfamily)
MPQKVTPFLWLPGRLAEAVDFYTSVFPDGEVIERTVQDGEPTSPPSARAASSSPR